MARRTTGLNLEEHRAIGARMMALHDELIDLTGKVHDAYPKASREARGMLSAHRALDKAKSQLDDAVCREHPTNQDVLGFYYGERDKARAHDMKGRGGNGHVAG